SFLESRGTREGSLHVSRASCKTGAARLPRHMCRGGGRNGRKTSIGGRDWVLRDADCHLSRGGLSRRAPTMGRTSAGRCRRPPPRARLAAHPPRLRWSLVAFRASPAAQRGPPRPQASCAVARIGGGEEGVAAHRLWHEVAGDVFS